MTARRSRNAPYWDAAQAAVRAQHPRFFAALVADAKVTAAYRGERAEYHGRRDALIQALRLMWVTDAFLAQALYRAKARLQALGVPVLPTIAHRLAIATAQVCIGDTVLMRPGVFIGHGGVVIDGFVEIRHGTRIMPGVTIGLRGQALGPTISKDVVIGTGAKVLGRITIGRGARIGANAVVITDVPAGATAVGVPARIVHGS
jgi:serine O-acetyltransferase